MSGPEPEFVDRFRRDLERLLERSIGREEMFALAVSGGSDSLAMLLLAQAACPGRIIAATVDHGLRAEAVGETAHVAGLCRDLDVPHQTLRPDIAFDSFENLQERTRNMRYRLLGRWATQGEATALLTAHHADDQAETFLMRAARGAGIGGLSAIRAVSFNLPKFYWPEDFATLGDTRPIIARPLLAWRKATLRGIVEEAGIAFVSDPTNDDPRHDRTRFRRLLDENGWLSPDRFAKAAAHLAEGEDALAQLATMFFVERLRFGDGMETRLDMNDLPREIRRRMIWMAIKRVRVGLGILPDWRGGEDVEGLLQTLERGQTGTLAGVVATGGATWWFREAPPRRADVRASI